MTLTLQITPETEAELRKLASLAGQTLESLALEAIVEKLIDGETATSTMSREEWHRRFDALIASMPKDRNNLDADISRSSAYADRGL